MNRSTLETGKSGRAPKRPGRNKPCAYCGALFWCKASLDVGGTRPEKKFCSNRCGYDNRNSKREEIFWSYVDKNGPNGCWIWNGCRDKWGYGDLSWFNKHIQAHRLAWKLLRGDPGKLDCLHKCNNPPCCNPDHLYLGTDLENARDRTIAGTHTHGERSGQAKLTDKEALEIRAKYWRKVSGKRTTASNAVELSKVYGVTPQTISQVALGRRWTHL